MAVLAYTRADSQLAFIEFDATVQEGHSSTVSVTEHALEDGTLVSDHVRTQPDLLTLEVSITNTPVRFPPAGVIGAQATSSLKLADERAAFRSRTNPIAGAEDLLDVTLKESPKRLSGMLSA